MSSDDIITIVCDRTRVTRADLYSRRKTKGRAYARHLAAYVMREFGKMSYPDIARALRRSDHTTAMSSCQRIVKRVIEGDDTVALDLKHITERLGVLERPCPHKPLVDLCGDIAETLRQVAQMLDERRRRILLEG